MPVHVDGIDKKNYVSEMRNFLFFFFQVVPDINIEFKVLISSKLKK